MTQDSRQQCQPSDADWYVEVIFGRDIPGGAETNYAYGYWAGAQPGPAEVASLVPPGFSKLESVIKPAGRLPH